MSRNRRKCPRFSISMWNCFSRVHLDLPRTNDAVEGWHNAFHVCIINILSTLLLFVAHVECCW